MKPKVMIALNTAWNLVNFRAGLIRALVAAGYEVVAVAPDDEYSPKLAALGCRFVPLPMDNKGVNPGRDLLLLFQFLQVLRRERPDVFLGYTVKPNVYGSIAAHLLGIPVINNVAGLGTAFIKQNWLTKVVKTLYRVALFRSAKVFFQNDEDLELFVTSGLVKQQVTGRLPGSGVDLARFAVAPLPSAKADGQGVVRFLLIARMLREKGVAVYVEAGRLLREKFPNAEFCLLGFLDVQNPSAISREEMAEWVAEGVVNYLGSSDDVRKEIAMSDCVVLPSYYREGTPRSLLEAAAMGRPIITTDAIGCRDVVDNGVNGYLCNPRDAEDLADKMALILEMPMEKCVAMGLAGRSKIEREFDENIVINCYLEAISKVSSVTTAL